MILRIILITICFGLSVQTALAAIAPPRPFSGEGLLVIRPFPSRSSEPCCTLPIYGEPGVERITDLERSDLPSLTPVIQGRTGEYSAAVTGKKGNWLHIVYDDAGREGWLESSRAWEYVTWNHFLKGRAQNFCPG
ncbi:hypothetical protein [Geotalea toluenoxydans]|uniref:hypothetical protein n=1 Tax=Geotalea toluenoxydans TaxID=421624 RepID=UPI000A778467|nr:hypothetical protein [Geotalea toluenoxydans]